MFLVKAPGQRGDFPTVFTSQLQRDERFIVRQRKFHVNFLQCLQSDLPHPAAAANTDVAVIAIAPQRRLQTAIFPRHRRGDVVVGRLDGPAAIQRRDRVGGPEDEVEQRVLPLRPGLNHRLSHRQRTDFQLRGQIFQSRLVDRFAGQPVVETAQIRIAGLQQNAVAGIVQRRRPAGHRVVDGDVAARFRPVDRLLRRPAGNEVRPESMLGKRIKITDVSGPFRERYGNKPERAEEILLAGIVDRIIHLQTGRVILQRISFDQMQRRIAVFQRHETAPAVIAAGNDLPFRFGSEVDGGTAATQPFLADPAAARRHIVAAGFNQIAAAILTKLLHPAAVIRIDEYRQIFIGQLIKCLSVPVHRNDLGSRRPAQQQRDECENLLFISHESPFRSKGLSA